MKHDSVKRPASDVKGHWRDIVAEANAVGEVVVTNYNRPEVVVLSIERYAKLNTYQTDLLAWFLNKLASTPEGNGSLLDSSLFMYGAALSNPNLHAHMDLPIALVGGPAGSGGRHVLVPSNTPLSNLLVTVLDRVDVPVDTVGDSTGRIELESASNA